ncbi:MAG: ABC transporter permease [Candidatus Bipolaricaulia bacterium]
MGSYIIRRLVSLIPIWLVVSFLTFSIMYLVPGDPVVIIIGPEASPEARQRFIERLHLDEPFLTRYVSWLSGIVLRGDLGESIFLDRPVTQGLLERAPVTVSLGIGAILFATMLGIPTGILAALRPNSVWDSNIMIISMIGLSIPEFLLGLFLILTFGVYLGWFPIGGYVNLLENPGESLRHLLMPCFTLGFIWAALVARMTRANMIEILNNDYIRTARSKGLKERVVVWKHALRVAMIPVVTVIGFTAILIVAGAFITEIVFTLPGMGNLAVSSIKHRDYPMVQGIMLVISTGVLLINLLIDLSYTLLDPRIRYQ